MAEINSRKKKRILFIRAAIVSALALLLLQIILMLFTSPEGAHSTYAAREQGLKAFHDLIVRTDLPADRWRLHPARLAEEEGVLISVETTAKPMPTLEECRPWIESGGTFVLVPSLLSPCLESREWRNGPRLEGEEGLLAHIDDLELEALNWYTLKEEAREGFDTMLSLDGDILICEKEAGKGRMVVALLLPFLSNGEIGRGDNVFLGMNLIDRYFDSGKILFNEHAQGFGRRSRAWSFFFEPPGLWLTIQIFVFFAALFALGLVRFGPPRPEQTPPPRSREEYVDAMGAFLLRIRAFGGAARHLKEAFREEIRRRFMGNIPATNEEIEAHACRIRPGLKEKIKGFFESGEDGLDGDGYFLLYEELTRLRERMIHEDRGGV